MCNHLSCKRPPPISDHLPRTLKLFFPVKSPYNQNLSWRPHILLLLLYIQYLYWMRDNFKLKSKCYWYMWTYLVCILSRHWRPYWGVWTLQATQDQKRRSRSLKWKKGGIKGDWSRQRKRKDLSSGSDELECGFQEMTLLVYCLWYLTTVNEVCLYSKKGNRLPNARWDPNRSLKFGSWVRQAKRPSRSKTVEN